MKTFYTYYKTDGSQGYLHPTIEIFQDNVGIDWTGKKKQYITPSYIQNPILKITSQTDAEKNHPYAHSFELENLEPNTIKLVKSLSPLNHWDNWKRIIKALKVNKIQRRICCSIGDNSYYIPKKFKKHPEFWVNAIENGYRIEK